MFIDAQMHLHDKTVVTTAAQYKGDSIALETLASLQKEGSGEPMECLIQITTVFAGGTSAVFELITATEASLATDEPQASTGVIVTAQLTLGKKFRLPLNINVDDSSALYFGLMCTGVGTHTGGSAFSAWIQRVGEDQNSYL